MSEEEERRRALSERAVVRRAILGPRSKRESADIRRSLLRATTQRLRIEVDDLRRALEKATGGKPIRIPRTAMTVRELRDALDAVGPALGECRVAIDLGGAIAEVTGVRCGDDGASDFYVELDFGSVRLRRPNK